ncbi:NAD(P)/FAD-dependent oxidoreductase [Demequina sp. NBRC 110053]|uniref:NAD(P)/FAD-dependent oxidoreductase n=1 Tax=Demequina sp. NBRC 110053 TaxID=1570342 RepID=UPI000A03DB06|nr:FAD-dependent oxidoreductase [Demequina sp. NBRC 110053]
MRRILIIGGGYAGLYTAWGLERRLRRGEAEVVLVDPRQHMTYQPFLPEVVAGSIEPRHAAVSLRRHLRRTRVIAGSVVELRHAARTATIAPLDGEPYDLPYDTVVTTAGAVTRTLPIPGLLDTGIGLKTVEEAAAIRDRLVLAFEQAAELPAGPERDRLLTVTVVGGGFSGVEVLGEMMGLARSLVRRFPTLNREDVAFHLVEAAPRILPEVSDRPGRWVVSRLEHKGARVHLSTSLVSAVNGHVELSDGVTYDTGLLVWTAGNATNPVVARHSDLPLDARGRVTVGADLRVRDGVKVVPDAWAAGDDAAVPDLALSRDAAITTVPNAQHAVRQAELLARNIVAVLRGREPRPYRHRSIGVVATLGLGDGIFQFRRLVIKGLPAWFIHRGYHVLAIPSWERKAHVLAVWLVAAVFGRDIVALPQRTDPRRAFVTGGEPVPPSPEDSSDTTQDAAPIAA